MGPMAVRNSLNGADLRLLHEALTYTRKRSYRQVESVRIQGLLDRVEELLLDPDAPAQALRLSPPEQDLLAKEIPLYCEALTQRGGSVQGAREAARLREVLEIMVGGRRRWWSRWLHPGRRP